MISNRNELQYLYLLSDILRNGKASDDRTKVGTIRVFGRMLKFDLTERFPLLTTKQVAWKGIVSELLWFLEGSGDERRLAEIRYGKPRSELEDKETIWTPNANSPYWKSKAKFVGDCGEVYGVQWRHWKTGRTITTESEVEGFFDSKAETIDQIAILIDGLKNDPFGRRHILTAWNPGELVNMALPPCHMTSQYFVEDGRLSCKMDQRKH